MTPSSPSKSDKADTKAKVQAKVTPMPGSSLASLVGHVPHLTKHRVSLFRKLEIHSVADLLRHIPLRYQHEAPFSSIADLVVDRIGTTSGRLEAVRWVGSHPQSSKGRFEATLVDDFSTLRLTWFNARYLQGKLHAGDQLLVKGKVTSFHDYKQIVNPKWSILAEDSDTFEADHDERHRPVYPSTKGLTSETTEKVLAELLPTILPQIHDPLPSGFLKDHNMPALRDAFRMTHQPTDPDEPKAARRRLAFNELLLLQLGISIRRAYVDHRLEAPALPFTDRLDEHIRERLPFELTSAQQRVTQEIAQDLQRQRPMNRLLQGDVGSGKTAVALYAMLMAVADRKQAAMVAPTELLARQHFLSLSRMLEGSSVRLGIIVGSMKKALRQERLDQARAGELDLLIGTHALLSDVETLPSLALAVIDEQHRFGVRQRAAMRVALSDSKGDEKEKSPARLRVPHQLVMTATPIPRTLSMTLLGDLDVSVIDELPPGRTPVTTRVVHPDESDKVYEYLGTRLDRGEQAYVVLPVIESRSSKRSTDDQLDAFVTESQRETAAQRSAATLKSVNEHVEMLRQKLSSKHRVEPVHGKMDSDQLESTMKAFRSGDIGVLVATTVIEVGVDVPQATMIVIEHAERFGLAQLHQLRGRVGRGATQSKPLCVLIADANTDDGQSRLTAIASTTDGFKIAEADLAIRGMGQLLGTQQSGAPPLRIANIPEDMDLLQLARRDADQIIGQDPTLSDDQWKLLRKVLLREHGEQLGLIDVG